MHILFLTDNFPPETNAPASRTVEHCRAWVRAGARVTVITGNPNFPEGRLMAGHRNRLRPQHEIVDGIAVVRVWTYISANSGFLRRVLDHLSFALMAVLVGLLTDRPDVIVATSPQFFTSWAGWALSKLRRRPWIFELRDLWPESIVAVGAMKRGHLVRWLERIELALYRDAERVVALTGAFKANLVARGIPAAKIDVVTNGVALDHFTPRAPDEALRRTLGVAGKTVVGYIGTHGAAHALGFILDCAAERPGHHFLFVGAGAEKARLVTQAAALALTNVTFHDPVPKDEVPAIIAACDIMLVPLRRDPLFTTVIPSKIFEAAAMCRPILLGVEGEAQAIVERYGAGVCFAPEDRSSFLAELDRISKADEHARLAEGCTALAAAYDREALAARMLKICEQLG